MALKKSCLETAVCPEDVYHLSVELLRLGAAEHRGLLHIFRYRKIVDSANFLQTQSEDFSY